MVMNTVKQEEDQDLGRAPNRESVVEDNKATQGKCSPPPKKKVKVTRTCKVTRRCKAYPKVMGRACSEHESQLRATMRLRLSAANRE